jgi:HSP20 family protein
MSIGDLIPWGRSSGRRDVARRDNGGDPVNALQTDLNRAFEDFWRSLEEPLFGRSGGNLPAVDVRETDKEVEVIAELPGMSEKDIDVQVAEGALTIRGEKRDERHSEERGYVLHERSVGYVERVVPLPEGVDINNAKAKFRNGVLTITLPKTHEAQQSVKHISVRRH